MIMSQMDMREVTIMSATAASARCSQGDWAETADTTAEVPRVLSDGAMHAITTGHRVHEHVDRDLTVEPL
jgi:hypothetical protein